MFQGTADGRLVAYDAKDGTNIWEFEIGSGIIAPPVTYEVDGEQYLSVAVGWGGGIPALWARATKELKPGTVYTFKLGADNPLPEYENLERTQMVSMEYDSNEEDWNKGRLLYDGHCVMCHGFVGMNGGSIPNLAYTTEARLNILDGILLQGAYVEKGMPDFSDRLSEDDVRLIKNYILAEVDKINTP